MSVSGIGLLGFILSFKWENKTQQGEEQTGCQTGAKVFGKNDQLAFTKIAEVATLTFGIRNATNPNLTVF